MSKPAYVFATIKVPDLNCYIEQYAKPFLSVIEEFDGEVLAATPQAQILEGHTNKNWTVLLKFPSLHRAEEFYHSDAYAPLLEKRQTALSEGAFMTLFEGLH
ncbi:DUF1330 domain-containing protein [Alteromonas sediminis]|uniref:DUF1330 domain-containing protein n=1 Tax=Alteromonas sediminis TaxID=2259342 RepID=A0A3N5Y635_9ALTE|nr:DUF1330 domain-containing protein [Alteromonas sediminis]RPJ68763.1 DUF1330 domain-containing protein [Alteromonas sediminis]